ncbi:hypothetical protein NN561_008500 [Cricetulus griseus]
MQGHSVPVDTRARDVREDVKRNDRFRCGCLCLFAFLRDASGSRGEASGRCYLQPRAVRAGRLRPPRRPFSDTDSASARGSQRWGFDNRDA